MNARWLIAATVLAGCGSSKHAGSDGDGSAGGESRIVTLSGGRYHTCALLRDGAIYCWGQGAYRQLGGDYGYQGTARAVATVTDAVALECGNRFTCAIRPGGAVWCWGDDGHGQAGTASTVPCGDATIDSVCVTTPQPVVGLESDVSELALGQDHACARMADGSVRCWGDNSAGQVGASALADVTAPFTVPGLSGVTQIVAGDAHSCALEGNPGTVWCWGANQNAQVGNGGTAAAVLTPTMVSGISDAVEIVAGGTFSCARRASGQVLCWGYNYMGWLGIGSTSPTRVTAPKPVANLDDAVQLAGGHYHGCALRAGGQVACWGYNARGQVGDGSTSDRSAAVAVSDLASATTVAAGFLHSCASVGAGSVMCWGDDLGGQLGDDRVTNNPNPIPIPTQGLPPP
jgi:alpha-tubulin suppressor-like RCC1 family protein